MGRQGTKLRAVEGAAPAAATAPLPEGPAAALEAEAAARAAEAAKTAPPTTESDAEKITRLEGVVASQEAEIAKLRGADNGVAELILDAARRIGGPIAELSQIMVALNSTVKRVPAGKG